MSNVSLNKIEDREKDAFPIFREIEQRLEAARKRAYELFQGRGGELGRELEDWFRAEAEILGEAQVKFEEKAGQFDISVTLPGFDPKQAEVTVTPTEIAIHAKKEVEHGYSEVLRRIELDKPVRPDQVTARLENGLLHIVAPCTSQNITEPGKQVTVAVA
jgi:HSP20 family molecular chaperone IbpA